MKKELNGGVVIGVIVVVVVVAVVFGWRAIAPPAPAGIKSFDKNSLKVMQEEHAKSAAENRKEQERLLNLSGGK